MHQQTCPTTSLEQVAPHQWELKLNLNPDLAAQLRVEGPIPFTRSNSSGRSRFSFFAILLARPCSSQHVEQGPNVTAKEGNAQQNAQDGAYIFKRRVLNWRAIGI